MSKRIAFTGGGTAGHVMPNVALIDHLRAKGWEMFYIGSSPIEQRIIASSKIEYHSIFSGKLRRYFSFQNFVDIGKIVAGLAQSLAILAKKRPQIVFSKGGYVSVPVCYAAYLLRIPVVTHESDFSPGLATKLLRPIAHRIFYSFEESSKFFAKEKSLHVGNPIRAQLSQGNKMEGTRFCGFREGNEPVVLVMGGSLGAKFLNDVMSECLPELVQKYKIIHLTGPGKTISFSHPNYKSFEFVSDELRHILKLADVVVSRAGANSIFEFLSLRKPMLLIPLEFGSRGDQVENAEIFQNHGWALMLRQSEINRETLLQAIEKLVRNKEVVRKSQDNSKSNSSVETIEREINLLTGLHADG
jgi:UDP-N-acetylglucosamine--N-acetylmuramyl-(pentapeptide) pyrophosphoryl-undecaprenol N-acetylglucosamine transferase